MLMSMPFKKSLFISLFSLSVFLSIQALYGMQALAEERVVFSPRLHEKSEDDSESYSSTSSEEDFSNFSFDTRTFKTPFKVLISRANEGDVEAQETVATLLFEYRLPYSHLSLIEPQNWLQIREKMETDPKFLYLAYYTKGSSEFGDYFEKFYADEKGETNPHKIAILALMCQKGLFRGDIPNLKKAIALCERAISMKDDVPLFYNIAGDAYAETINVKKGQNYYEKGERLGDLGCIYSRAIWHQRAALQEGLDEAAREFHKNEASQRFERLECAGYTKCYRTLAALYREGAVLPQNPEKSLYYSILARDSDNLKSIAYYLTSGDTDVDGLFSGDPLREPRNPKSFAYSRNQLASKTITPSVSSIEELINNNCENILKFEGRIQECFRILREYKAKNAHGLFLACIQPTLWLTNLLFAQEQNSLLAVHTFQEVDFVRYGSGFSEDGDKLITVGQELVPLAKYLISLFNEDLRESEKKHELNESESPILTFFHAANVIKALRKLEKSSFVRACVRAYRLTGELGATEKSLQDLGETPEVSQEKYLKTRLLKINLDIRISNQVLEKKKEALRMLKEEEKALQSLRRRLKQFILQEAFNPSFMEEYDFLKQLPLFMTEEALAEPEPVEVPEDPFA